MLRLRNIETFYGLKDQPDKGSIELCGQRIEVWDTAQIVRLGLSLVPEGREVFEELTVRENLLMGAYLRRGRRQIAQDLERVEQTFPILQQRRDQFAGTLSGGEQQMLAIARALMARPRLLLLDEPSLGLAPVMVQQIFSVIRQINEQGTTILLVEQNAKMALEVADHGYVLENGRIVMDDRCEALLQNEDVQEFYLGARREAGVSGERRYKRKKRWH
jgi:branched-chain amino acid transport system ATP-binding protein